MNAMKETKYLLALFKFQCLPYYINEQTDKNCLYYLEFSRYFKIRITIIVIIQMTKIADTIFGWK